MYLYYVLLADKNNNFKQPKWYELMILFLWLQL